MKVAVWHRVNGGMDERERRRLCDRVVARFHLSPDASYKDACERVGEVMSESLGATVELKFVSTPGARFSGATARRVDGAYVVFCVKSGSWYHRLGILLHELAHVLLDHQPVTLQPQAKLRQFAPHLPGKMACIIAERTAHTQDEEREAEEFADELLERLTDQRHPGEGGSSDMSPHVLRIAEGLTDHPFSPDRDAG